MKQMHQPRRLATAVCLAAFAVLAGCADQSTTGLDDREVLAPQFSGGSDGTFTGEVTVCKDGPPGTYTFRIPRKHALIGTLSGGTTVVEDGVEYYVFTRTVPASGEQDCDIVYVSDPEIDKTEGMRIFEVDLPDGVSFSAVVTAREPTGGNWHLEDPYGIYIEPHRSTSWLVTFYNTAPDPEPEPEPDPATAGCSPGYWKQSQHFGNWTAPYTTTSSYNAVFGVNVFPASTTLLGALNKGGGGMYRLGRQSTAVLLSAAHPLVNNGLTPAQVIAEVQAAVAGGTKGIADLGDKYEKLSDDFDCPLGRAP